MKRKEVNEFYRITKPLPFRKIRLWIRSILDRITYVIYNILYKLNIIEKYSFNDVIRNEVPINISPIKFNSGCVHASLVFSLEHEEYANDLYFHKKGDKLHKYYTIVDSHFHNLKLTAHLEDIGISITEDSKPYYVDKGLPEFKVYFNEVTTEPFCDEPLKPKKVETKTIDMRKLTSLRYCDFISTDEYYKEHLDNKEYEGQISTMVENMTFAFINYFRGVKFSDLTI